MLKTPSLMISSDEDFSLKTDSGRRSEEISKCPPWGLKDPNKKGEEPPRPPAPRKGMLKGSPSDAPPSYLENVRGEPGFFLDQSPELATSLHVPEVGGKVEGSLFEGPPSEIELEGAVSSTSKFELELEVALKIPGSIESRPEFDFSSASKEPLILRQGEDDFEARPVTRSISRAPNWRPD